MFPVPAIRYLVLLTFLGTGCATSLGKKAKPALPPEPTGHVLFDVDLTKGSAAPGQVTGGVFDGGWRVTAPNGQRIAFDAGHPVSGGFLEVSFTLSQIPQGAGKAKMNWVGLYEDAALTQEPRGGDVFYIRAGQDPGKWSRIKAYGKKFDKGEWENAVGKTADWVADDHTVQTVKLEWRMGLAIFHDAKGAVHVCPKKICSAALAIDKLRYAFVGSDAYTNLSPEGMRFVRVKLVEYAAADTAP